MVFETLNSILVKWHPISLGPDKHRTVLLENRTLTTIFMVQNLISSAIAGNVRFEQPGEVLAIQVWLQIDAGLIAYYLFFPLSIYTLVNSLVLP